ncbi:sensor domain-containing diguanylate cyclase [Spiribacter halobius]|uniref:Sensor domain-containing diguanylate cyclase n=1 Tax=Sediminicurvatus halobius TaxID=2182432 RepID=A0A2U2N557_9GAMM|nr:diguanylate cyclase [Spiribacter halobius]PWG64355.1 sensor domain-containing diguanylate cyclase [Spiribacter halobius]UEX79298.1 diguanylate cyclase [Spiribacter halobius]
MAVESGSLPPQPDPRELIAEAVEASYNAVVITTAELTAPGPRIVYVNAAFQRMSGYAPEEVIGRSPRLLQGPASDTAELMRLRACLEAGHRFEGRIVNYRRDGRPYHVEWSVAPIRDAAGRTTHFISLQRDVTRRVAAETERGLLLAALDEIPDEVLITDVEGVVIYANRSYRGRTGLAPDAVRGSLATPLDPNRHDGVEALWRRLQAGEGVAHIFTELDAQGRPRHIEQSMAPVRDEAGCIRQYVLTGRDITDRVEAERELKRLATTDALTGLNNRLRFEALVERELNRMTRHGGRFCLVLFDLDGFKSVNDRHGHEAGDAVLVELTRLVAGHVRAEDTLGRWGGEEFTLLLPALGLEQARQAADKLRGLVAAHAFPGVDRITASFGVTEAAPGDTVRSLLRRADAALYRAKDAHKNRVEVVAAGSEATLSNTAE